MCAWLGRMPAILGCVLLAASVSAAPPSTAQLRALVRKLDAEEFALREQAGSSLVAAGESAIEALAEGVTSGSPEAAWRASSALEQIAVSGSDATLERVAAVLQRLSHGGKPGLKSIAKELHAKQARLRHDRALAKIRSLGGKFDGDVDGIDEAADRPLLAAALKLRAGLEGEEPAGLGVLDVALQRFEDLLGAAAADPAPSAPAEPSPPPDPPLAEAGLPAPAPDPPPDLPPDEITPIIDVPHLAVGIAMIGDAFVAPGLEEPAELDSDASEQSLRLDKSWRGGDAALAALRDLPALISLSLNRAPLTDAALKHIAELPKLQELDIQSTPFTSQALLRFHDERPQVRIFARGEAILGVNAEIAGACVLTGIYAGSGAAEAGLKAGDQIVSVNDQKVRDFSDLTITISTHKPGDKIQVGFVRDRQQRTVQVLLKERKELAAANRVIGR